MNTGETPWAVVGGVSVELERMSSLLNVLSTVQGDHSVIELVDFGNSMGVLRDLLDQQIKALDGIRWTPERR